MGRLDAHGVAVLSIGVGSFDDGAGVEDLGFVSSRMEEVQQAFEQLGAAVESALNPDEGKIESLLRHWLINEPKPTAVTVVHLIGHGRADRGDRLAFVARDDRDVDVDRWIEKAQQEVERGGNRRRVVFLVDTCSAGLATGRQQISELGSERGVWALGATVSGSPTEGGRFSGWIATALHRLRDRDFYLNTETISFELFVDSLARLVMADTSGQRLSFGFSSAQGDADWPFLPVPQHTSAASGHSLERLSLGYVPGEEDLRRDMGSRIAAGEEIGDALYFLDRASGRGLVSVDIGFGFFSGRFSELKQYMAWQAGDSPLLTVTGAAGAGKSGLLGVIVCAAHPELRGRFHELWQSTGQPLPEVSDLVALHARQRSAQQVIDTIVGHARLPRPKEEDEDVPSSDGPGAGAAAEADATDDEPWTADLLRRALVEEGKNRLIVLDAVDESTDPQSVLGVVAELIAGEDRDGTPTGPPCRILLGGRHEVIDALAVDDRMPEIVVDRINLDDADTLAVEEDVRHYIERLLPTREPYGTGTSALFVGLLAKKGAQGIVRGLRPENAWGPFLLAGLYIHYLMTLKHPPQDEVSADAHARQASANLPDLLEAVLKARAEEFPALRAVLAILARSRGDGMPRTALRRCLRALNADGIQDEKFLGTLRDASPFLRTGIDPVTKEALYRIFQQGLADYLRDHPVDEDTWETPQQVELERKLLSALVDPFLSDRVERSDGWEPTERPAEPYVFRHALGHVTAAGSVEHAEALLTDPYFLVRFDPREDHRALDLVQSERAATYIRLLNAAWFAHTRLASGTDRAWVFAFDADRLGLREYRQEFTRIANELAFRPEQATSSLLWAEGGRPESKARIVECATSMLLSGAFSADGELFAVGGQGEVRLLGTESWRPAAPPIRTAIGSVNCIAFSPDGRLLAFGSHAWTRNIQLWDVRQRVPMGKPWRHTTGTVTSLSFSHDSRWLAVGSSDSGASVWDVTGDLPVEVALLDSDESAFDAKFSPDDRYLALSSQSGLRLWRTTDWTFEKSLGREATERINFSPDGRCLTSVKQKKVTIWFGESFADMTEVEADADGIDNLAFSPDGSLLAVGGWTSLTLLDVPSLRVVNQLSSAGYSRLLSFHPSDSSLLVTASDSSSSLHLWSTFARHSEFPRLPNFLHVATSPDGRLVATYDADTSCAVFHDPATGREVGRTPLKLRSNPASFHFSPDSRFLVALSSNSPLYLIPTESFPSQTVRTINFRGITPSYPPKVMFSPDSRLIAIRVFPLRSGVNVINVWDAHSLRLKARIPLAGPASSVEFAGPNKMVVNVNGAIAVYDCDGTKSEDLHS